MFDQFKNLGQLAGMLKNAGRIREQLQQAQEHLRSVRVSAETGGGAVKATATGALRLHAVEIDPAMFAALVESGGEEDRRMAEDLIVGAVNAALEKAQRLAAEEMSRRAREMGLPVDPDSDLGGLLGQ